jgi:hypothetical protein
MPVTQELVQLNISIPITFALFVLSSDKFSTPSFVHGLVAHHAEGFSPELQFGMYSPGLIVTFVPDEQAWPTVELPSHCVKVTT